MKFLGKIVRTVILTALALVAMINSQTPSDNQARFETPQTVVVDSSPQ